MRQISLLLIGIFCCYRNSASVQAAGIASKLFSSTSSPSSGTKPKAGGSPILDASCNMEDLEQANDAQLFEILQELKQTQFFRNFVVDLQHKCPLQQWGTTSSTMSHGGGSSPTEHGKPTTTKQDTAAASGASSYASTSSTENEHGAFECTGGKDELDEDAPPLCEVDVNNSGDPFSFDSNALHSLQTTGFESKDQEEAYTWKKITDTVFTEVEELPSTIPEDALLPDSFWKDMCSSIGLGDGTTTVNLALNPERNTGYNGTHIWRAIYEENCIAVDGEYDDMCLEERVLYRLLSGLHTQTTVSIAKNYWPPSKRKGRVDWEPNPSYFMEKFADNPDHIRNLHFSYVVILRALRKATPFLYDYNGIRTGNAQEDESVAKLLKRLLDSSILKSCSSVFSAFDESLLFQEDPDKSKSNNHNKLNVTVLQKNFKGVFHNVSSILDCVQCQQCRLHGKLVMTGYGAALKVLFMQEPSLEKNEIVALLNTAVKLSESVRDVKELTELYKHQQQKDSTSENQRPAKSPVVAPAEEEGRRLHKIPTSSGSGAPSFESLDLVDTVVGLVASMGRQNWITFEREQELVQLALQRHPELLILGKHYGSDVSKFWQLSKSIIASGSGTTKTTTHAASPQQPDAIVIGSGLAGMAATLNLLDRGGRVVMMEKEHLLGGNSNKASSGINACCPEKLNSNDSLGIFYNDTLRSAGSSAQETLITTLTSKSADAVAWLKNRVGVDLSLTSQLGGHSAKRTHRPSNGMAGAEIIYGMQTAVKAYAKTGQVVIMTDTKVTQLVTAEDGSVIGVAYVDAREDPETAVPVELHAPNVVLATGGFAADRSSGSYLEKHRPELLKMPTTAGAFSTGDGITLATELDAGTVDMDKVQVHPTGWVDPSDPENTSKVLAAELMRGVGGILINDKGQRFCNELGTRSYVTNKMLGHDEGFRKTGNWSLDATVPTFSLVLSSSAAADGKKHVDLYSHKRLLTRLEGVEALAEWMGQSKSTIMATLRKYQQDAAKGEDEFGKTTFRGVPDEDLKNEVFYAGTVTPVLHYCMGGITIDAEGSVLNADGEIIPGLHAAGEVSGGVVSIMPWFVWPSHVCSHWWFLTGCCVLLVLLSKAWCEPFGR